MGDNLLGKILIVPNFISPEDCAAIIDLVRSRREASLGVGSDYASPTPPRPTLAPEDISDARALHELLRSGGALQRIVVESLRPDLRAWIERTTSFGSADQDVVSPLLDAMNRQISDEAFFARHSALLEPAIASHPEPTLRHHLSYLRGRSGLMPTLATRWFHSMIFEEVLLPGALRKQHRLVDRAVDPHRSLGLGDEATGGRPALRAVLASSGHDQVAAAVGSDDYATALDGIDALFGSAVARAVVCAAYASDRDAPPRDDVHTLAVVLAGAYPGRFGGDDGATGSNAGRKLAKSVRNCLTVEFTDLKTRLEESVQVLATEHVEPHFDIHIRAVQEMQFLKYRPGGYFMVHADGEMIAEHEGRKQWVKHQDRDVSVLLYLNASSEYEGGLLRFPRQHILIKPELGMAVAFPSDHRFMHAAQEITSGTRYVVATWLSCEEGAPVGTVSPTISW